VAGCRATRARSEVPFTNLGRYPRGQETSDGGIPTFECVRRYRLTVAWHTASCSAVRQRLRHRRGDPRHAGQVSYHVITARAYNPGPVAGHIPLREVWGTAAGCRWACSLAVVGTGWSGPLWGWRRLVSVVLPGVPFWPCLGRLAWSARPAAAVPDRGRREPGAVARRRSSGRCVPVGRGWCLLLPGAAWPGGSSCVVPVTQECGWPPGNRLRGLG
jgi:hypothetical protein